MSRPPILGRGLLLQPYFAQGRPSRQDGCPLDGWGDHPRRPGALGRGLLVPVERENGWRVAEAVGEATPGRRQRLLSRVG
ncbi:MAG TPA: hypothetical protein VFD01_22140 [Candidatus Dormibacteraeota bacterium]|nr:hypothetical protein [Candidatus Dormibacteraeota bacterium]